MVSGDNSTDFKRLYQNVSVPILYRRCLGFRQRHPCPTAAMLMHLDELGKGQEKEVPAAVSRRNLFQLECNY